MDLSQKTELQKFLDLRDFATFEEFYMTEGKYFDALYSQGNILMAIYVLERLIKVTGKLIKFIEEMNPDIRKVI
jgi:hypothetical protein